VGAHPGRIVKGLISCGSSDPVILLDELDKVSYESGRSDVASALLEILDPSLNRGFLDHFVDYPLDLSKVVFIATANSVAELPAALRDRLEVVRFTSYSNQDRLSIARLHLLPKCLAEHGLSPEDLEISDEVLSSLIQTYTSEAGVRDLERNLATLCRRAAKAKATSQAFDQPISSITLKDALGRPLTNRATNRTATVGAVWGLVVAAYGGDAFQIEAAFLRPAGMPKEIALTGNMGAIMRESAEAAVSFVRLRFGDNARFAEDLHIHAACGDRSKEGPSAGLAIALAVASALLDLPVPADSAITGEITLHGQVLPVGGIREKVLAAQRLGFRRVLLPQDNMEEAMRLEEGVLRDVELVPISNADEGLAALFPSILLGDGNNALRNLQHSAKG
jgi:ATP-dependent Lon protease